MSSPLRFPKAADTSATETNPRAFSEQQQFVSRIWRIFDDVGAPRPEAALLVRLRRRLFEGDAEAMAAALDDCADMGQLNVSVPYSIAVLRARQARGEFIRAPGMRVFVRGELSLDGSMVYNGTTWEPTSGGGSN